jgi:DNA polymerase III delta subunit
MLKVLDFLQSSPPPDWRVAVIAGEEEFLRSEAIEHLLKGIAKDTEIVTSTSENPTDLRNLLDDLCMQSLFGGDRLFVIRDADELVKNHSEVLERFFKQGVLNHPLVLEGASLVPKGRRAGSKTGLLGAIESLGGIVVTCGVLYDAPFQGKGPPWQSPLSRWLSDRARRYEKRLSLEDAYALHRQVGNKLRELDTELKKLAVFVGTRSAIREEDIMECVASGRQAGLFQVAEAVLDRDFRAALEQVDVVFERGIVDFGGRLVRDKHALAMMLVAAIAGRLRRVGQASEHIESGAPFEEAANAVKQPPFARDRLRAQLSAWRSSNDMREGVSELIELEGALKSGGGEPEVLISLCLTRLAGMKSSKRNPWQA